MFKDANGNFPLYEGDIRLLIPNWKIGDALPDGFSAVNGAEEPEFDADTQKIVSQIVRLESGEWQQTWLILDLTAEEIDTLQKEKAEKEAALKEQGII